MAEIRDGTEQAIADAWELCDALCDSVRVAVLLPENLSEDMTDSTWKKGWMDKEEYVKTNVLLQMKAHNPSLGFVEVGLDGKMDIDRFKGLEWLTTAGKLCRILCFLMHVTGGLPGRTTELVDIRIRNMLRHRGVMKDHGWTVFVTNYTKMTNVTGRDSYIAHFFPMAVS